MNQTNDRINDIFLTVGFMSVLGLPYKISGFVIGQKIELPYPDYPERWTFSERYLTVFANNNVYMSRCQDKAVAQRVIDKLCEEGALSDRVNFQDPKTFHGLSFIGGHVNILLCHILPKACPGMETAESSAT